MVIFLQKTFFFCVKCLAVMLKLFIFAPVLSNDSAEIAQLVEHNLAKVGVASSSLVFRSGNQQLTEMKLLIFCLPAAGKRQKRLSRGLAPIVSP